VSLAFILVLAYVGFYTAMGYGGGGASGYIHPLESPGLFLKQAFLERLPFLIQGILFPAPAGFSFIRLSSGDLWPLALAWGLSIVGVLILFIHLKKDPVARFMALGAFLSLLPRCAAYPHNRLLMLSTVGSAWVLGSFVVKALKRNKERVSSAEPQAKKQQVEIEPSSTASKKSYGIQWWSVGVKKAMAILVVVFHAGIAPVQAVYEQIETEHVAKSMWKAALESDLPGPGEAENARVVMLSSPYQGAFLPWLRVAAGRPYPRAVWMVTIGKGEFEFERSGRNSFLVRLLSLRGFLRSPQTGLDSDTIVNAGDLFNQGAMKVMITKVIQGQVHEFSVHLDLPLEHPDVWLVNWDGTRLVRRRFGSWPPPER